MKRITLALLLLFSITSFSQQGINYKAIIKDGSGSIVTNTSIQVDFVISDGGGQVYAETHAPTTDANGIVILNIGEGTPLLGTFSTIDWSSNNHFLNVLIDTGGGLQDLGATAFKMVPYAMHATTAGSATETQTFADVLALGSTANSQLKGVTDPTDTQDAATKAYTDAQNATINALIATLEARVIALEEAQPAVVGDLRAGGVVFWVDPADNRHGLVCALSDYVSIGVWGCYGTDLPSVPNVTTFPPSGPGAEIGDGLTNTNGILLDCPTAPAALAARSYGPEWFLPSAKELNEMYVQKATLEAVSGFAPFGSYYWSSTEDDNDSAWGQSFFGGVQGNGFKTNPDGVRAVRAF